MEKILTFDAEVVTDTKLIIEGTTEVEIDASKSITAEIAPDTYVLGSVGSFNTASSWVGEYVNELVRESIGTGGTLADALLNIRDYVMDEIEIGVNQAITQIENEYVSNSTLTTTLASELGPSRAAILDIQTTYATKTEAQAYSVDAIKASFGGNSSSSAIEAYIGSIAITHVDADSALASTVDVLIATLNETTVRIDTVDEINITQGTALVALDTSLTNVKDVLLPELQTQIDGVIDTWFYDGVPTTVNAPASEWTTDTVKMNHVGDLYYDKVSGYGYRFAYEDIEDTPDMGVIFSWIKISDVDVVLALANAATAQETADGKASVYYGTTAPTLKVDDVGDVFVNSSTKVTQIWNGTAWVNAATVDANTALAKLSDLEEARDGVVDTFYVTTAPASGMSYGDYWVDTDSWTGTKYIVSRYEALDGSSIGTLAWRTNTGETAVALGKAYRADVAGSAATIAQTAADTANTNAASALNKITDMASDNILSPVEKPSIITEYNVIIAEQAGIDSQATAYVITTEKTTYDTAVSALTTHLGTLTSPVAWNMLTGDTTIVGTTFRSKFSNVYTARQAVLNAITAKAKLLADTAQGTADGKIKTWYQTTAPVLTASDTGDIWVDTDAGNLTKTWSGTAWVDITNTKTNTAYTWSATSSKMITAPDGSVTGWSFGDGSNIQSYFKIKATNFSISDGTTGYVPFSITGSQIAFNGLVSFANTTGTPTHKNGTVSPTLGITTSVEGSTYYNTTTKEGFIVSSGRWIGNSSVTDTSSLALKDMSNVTTIDGGKITTGTLDANRLTTNYAWINGSVQSSDFTAIGGTGFRLKANAAGTSADPSIYGAYIKGGTIEGTTIVGQVFDIGTDLVLLTSGGYLTKGFFHTGAHIISQRTATDYSTLSLGTYIYAPNATSSTGGNRLVSSANSVQFLSSSVYTSYSKVYRMYGFETSYTVIWTTKMQIFRGTSILFDLSETYGGLNPNDTRTYTANGLNILVIRSLINGDGNYWDFYVSQVCDLSLTGDGELSFYGYVGSNHTSAPKSVTPTLLTMLCYNI